MTFAQTILASHDDASILPSNHRNRVSQAICGVLNQLSSLFPDGTTKKYEASNELTEVVRTVAATVIRDQGICDAVVCEFEHAAETIEATSIAELVRATEVASEDIEQELEQGKVNVLTMHKAKGLTAEAVIVVAAEDEYIPGRAEGDAVDDERRLLYVSLTRAKHHLFVTYCDRRTGAQRYTGRTSGRVNRTLTRFLRDGPLTPVGGEQFMNDLARQTR